MTQFTTIPNQRQPYPWWLWRSPREVRGRELRYVLTSFLMAAPGPMTVAELVEACTDAGVVFTGRPSKVVSDSLRWEMQWRRVVRLRRGVYAFHRIPRSTKRWIQVRATHLLDVLAKLTDKGAPNQYANSDQQGTLGLPAPPAAYLGESGPQRPPLAPDRRRSAQTIAKLKLVCSR